MNHKPQNESQTAKPMRAIGPGSRKGQKRREPGRRAPPPRNPAATRPLAWPPAGAGECKVVARPCSAGCQLRLVSNDAENKDARFAAFNSVGHCEFT